MAERWFAAAAAGSLVAFAVLAMRVRAAAELWPIDRASMRLRGQFTLLARVFTKMGRASVLTVLSCLFVLGASAARIPVLDVVVVIAAQLLSQAAVEAVKRVMQRARPREWVAREELGFSFPSGHAATAVVFYATSGFIVAVSSLPLIARIVWVVAAVTVAVGVDWSRMALGAHYASDVAGGTIFGVAWSAAALATIRWLAG